jgi:hypothetical protein
MPEPAPPKENHPAADETGVYFWLFTDLSTAIWVDTRPPARTAVRVAGLLGGLQVMSPAVEHSRPLQDTKAFETNWGITSPWHISRVGLVRGRSDHHAVTSSWTLQESQVESCEHQDNSDIHYQPFPEPVSEEQEIHSNYNGCHQHDVKYHT